MFLTILPTLPEPVPDSINALISGSAIFDSSCSQNARVYLIDRDNGYFLKSAAAGTLREEALMARYFHRAGFGLQVVAYESGARDFLLTARIPGEDCIHTKYLSDPIRLCDTLAETLRMLHDTPAINCPVTRQAPEVPAHNRDQLFSRFSADIYLGGTPFPSPESAWDLAISLAPALQPDALIHGDYCLPNVILSNWQFSGLIDLGGAGFGNRHHDLFWGLWSLCYNLKTDRYTQRFLECYGKNRFSPDLLRAVAALEGFGIG